MSLASGTNSTVMVPVLSACHHAHGFSGVGSQSRNPTTSGAYWIVPVVVTENTSSPASNGPGSLVDGIRGDIVGLGIRHVDELTRWIHGYRSGEPARRKRRTRDLGQSARGPVNRVSGDIERILRTVTVVGHV